MQVRHFSPERRVKLPGGHPGVHGLPIAMDAARLPQERRAALAERVGGLPILLDARIQVEVMDFDPHASIDPHSAGNDIVFLVVAGAGFVRVGDEARAVAAGDAVLWPAQVEHTAWTEETTMEAIVVNAPPSR
jgi:quercetin dioxygenase-like cupin family protein